MRTLSRVVFAAALGMSALPTIAGAQSIELNVGPGGVRVGPPPEERVIVRRRRVIEDPDEVVVGRGVRSRECEIRRERIWDPDRDRFIVRRTKICE